MSPDPAGAGCSSEAGIFLAGHSVCLPSTPIVAGHGLGLPYYMRFLVSRYQVRLPASWVLGFGNSHLAPGVQSERFSALVVGHLGSNQRDCSLG